MTSEKTNPNGNSASLYEKTLNGRIDPLQHIKEEGGAKGSSGRHQKRREENKDKIPVDI